MPGPSHAHSTQEVLIEHHFDDLDLQTEFDALSNNEDRLDYLEAMEALEHIGEHGTISLEEMKAHLSVE